MELGTEITGIKPPGDKWKKMKCIYDACLDGDVPFPDEVREYFDDEVPNDLGVEVKLPVQKACGDCKQNFFVHLKDIPKDVTTIKVTNTYN